MSRSIGPLLDAALRQGPGQPPALIAELERKLVNDRDCILLWTGAFRLGKEGGSWCSVSTPGEGDQPVTATPAGHIERLLSPLSNEVRVGLMQHLYEAERTSSELTELTGLKGGNLHYHLKELIYARYVEQRDGRYGLTLLGAQLLITVASIAGQCIKDRGDEGLQVSGAWDRE